MSQVRFATHKKSGKAVAVKVVARQKVKDIESLQRELNFLKVVDHPNVVRLYETFEDDDHLYLVMEHCDGDNLWDAIKKRMETGEAFEETEVREIAGQMLRAVAYCHSNNIVHRDIKPANFICSGSLKLVDFGVSGVLPPTKSPKSVTPHASPSSTSENGSSSSSRRSASEKFLTVKTGTDGYIAPEIMKSTRYGAAADMFSLGATIFTMLTGKSPKWLSAVGVYHFPDNYKLKKLSPEGRRLLAQLLSREPRARPTAVQALKDPWLQQAAANKQRKGQDKQLKESLKKFGQRTKLQRCARAAVAALADLDDSRHDVEELREAFIAADKNGTGEVEPAELAEILQMEEQAEAEALLAAIDNDRSGTIGFSEWAAAALPSSFFSCDDEAYQAFKLLDRDGDGQISAKDLHDVLPHVFSQERLSEDMKAHALDDGGQLDFQDFKKVLKGSLSSLKTSIEPPKKKERRPQDEATKDVQARSFEE